MAGRRRRHLACMVVAAAACPLAQCRESGHTVTIRPLTKPREPARDVPYRPQRTAPATSWLVNANIAAFVLLLGRGRLFSKLAMDDALVLRGQWHRALTACALHGGALHLYCNMMALRAIGPATERAFGSARFCGTYAASGLAGNLLFLNPTRPPSIGASGARALYESIARGGRTRRQSRSSSRRHLGAISRIITGAIFGLVGAYMVFLVRNGRYLGNTRSSLQALAQVRGNSLRGKKIRAGRWGCG